MTPPPRRGMTFLVPSGPGEDQKHLYVVLTDACSNGNHLAVPIQSVYPGEYHDSTCLLKEGDHPFVTHLSWVAYHRAEFLSHDLLIRQFEDFAYILKAPISEDVLC